MKKETFIKAKKIITLIEDLKEITKSHYSQEDGLNIEITSYQRGPKNFNVSTSHTVYGEVDGLKEKISERLSDACLFVQMDIDKAIKKLEKELAELQDIPDDLE